MDSHFIRISARGIEVFEDDPKFWPRFANTPAVHRHLVLLPGAKSQLSRADRDKVSSYATIAAA